MISKIIIWIMMLEELVSTEKDFRELSKMTGRDDFIICPIVVDNWNADLSPWEYKEGKKNFKGGARNFLLKVMTVYNKMAIENPQAKFILGGYSLAGLFSLWCGYETDVFDTIVSCSGSLWFPGFVDKYYRQKIQAGYVYMSLGNKEKKCRDKIMSEIENRTVKLFESLDCDRKEFVLEKGNHFTECRERMLRGFVWALDCE